MLLFYITNIPKINPFDLFLFLCCVKTNRWLIHVYTCILPQPLIRFFVQTTFSGNYLVYRLLYSRYGIHSLCFPTVFDSKKYHLNSFFPLPWQGTGRFLCRKRGLVITSKHVLCDFKPVKHAHYFLM